jgi:FkbM family methyltransferase
MSMNVEHTSQLGADMWVLNKYPNSFEGFFLDVGGADGFYISNTLELERHGWKGIAIDAFPRNFERRINTIVEKAVVSHKKNELVEFLIPTHYKDFSGIVSNLGKHKVALDNVESTTATLKTSLLGDILDEHNAPKRINYMNLDIEGSEYDVLSTFPFEKYSFDCISVEHNFEEPKRRNIHVLLAQKGYYKEKSVEWDDWYTNTELVKQ